MGGRGRGKEEEREGGREGGGERWKSRRVRKRNKRNVFVNNNYRQIEGGRKGGQG